MFSNKKSLVNYWMSYSDLMIGLLIIFIVIALHESGIKAASEKQNKQTTNKIDTLKTALNESNGLIASLKNKLSVTEAQLEKLKILETTFQKLADNNDLFLYNKECRRFELNCNVKFAKDSHNIPRKVKGTLIQAGEKLEEFLRDLHRTQPDTEFAIVIEGRAAKYMIHEGEKPNRITKEDIKKNKKVAEKVKVLSYRRARALQKLWQKNNIMTDLNFCDFLVVGNGHNGACRYELEEELKNKNFIIQIIPKFKL